MKLPGKLPDISGHYIFIEKYYNYNQRLLEGNFVNNLFSKCVSITTPDFAHRQIHKMEY